MEEFKSDLKRIELNSLKLRKLLRERDSPKQELQAILIDIKTLLKNQYSEVAFSFENVFNELLLQSYDPEDKKYCFFNELMEDCLVYAENSLDQNVALSIIETIASLEVRQILDINIDTILKLERLAERKTSEINLIDIALKLSDNKLFDRIEINSFDQHKIDKISNKNLKTKLNEVSLGERLTYFNSLKIDAKIIDNRDFLDNLHFISLCLNRLKGQCLNYHIFLKYDSFKFFTRLLEFIFNFLGINKNFDACLPNELLRDLCEIILKIIWRPFESYFLKENIIQILVNFFSMHDLIEFLFKNH